MKTILASSTLLWNARLDQIFDTIYKTGFDGIELWTEHFLNKKFDEKEYLKLSSLYPLKTYVHSSSWDLNLCSMNKQIRKASINAVINSIKLAERIGSFEVTVHPGRKSVGTDCESYIFWLNDSLKQIAQVADKLKIDVSLEIMEKVKNEFVTNLDMMRAVTGDMFDYFHYTVDVAHCDSEQELFELINNTPRVSKIHVSNRKKQKLHTPLSDGDYDFKKLLPKLFEYNLPLVIEGYDCTQDFKTFNDNFNFLKNNGGI